MRVTMLLDNIAADERFAAEHGLSLYIEAQGRRILFDTGQSDAFARNAKTLGIDLAAVDMAILSHGHYDHSGGMLHFMEINSHAPVYVSEQAFGRFEASDGRDIGIAPALADQRRIVRTGDFLALGPGLELHSCNAEPRPYASHSGGLLMYREGKLVQDDFLHEQYLCIRENGKLVVISGCSHKGILNIMHWLNPDVLIGGFHFMKLETSGEGKEELDRAAEELAGYETEYYTCHCTGKKQFDSLKEQLGDRLHYFAGGMTLDI
ncbi:MAG: MBL fold metallo-hydrolase [Mailhella sp.]|nr:MBL fold metallo-hydrolase [Mailhella sp.]MBQ9105524.1 MBL fold metallo-hydrolase [Mailhella sp.]